MDGVKILYEDEAIFVCLKPVGVSSETWLPELFCVHRLDTAVGGVMVYAKSKEAAAFLSGEIAARRMEKRYLAVCAGAPEPAEGEMRDLLFRDRAQNRSFVVQRPRKGVREAALRYRVLETAGDLALCEIALETGRSHQIRVQFASRKHPLFGDGKYGSREKGSIALWSHALRFAHPDGRGELRFASPPPEMAPWTLFHTEVE